MKQKSGEGVGTQVYLVVKTIQLTLVYFIVCKIYLKNCKSSNNQMKGLASGWYR